MRPSVELLKSWDVEQDVNSHSDKRQTAVEEDDSIGCDEVSGIHLVKYPCKRSYFVVETGSDFAVSKGGIKKSG